ncbi:MAG: SpoIIE family protein phosphatase [Phormidesmis sp.]
MTFNTPISRLSETTQRRSDRLSSLVKRPSTHTTDILVIDDDPLVVESLQRLLKKRGYQIAVAYDANKGYQKAVDLNPSVIICDLLLPGGPSGLDMCRQIKQNTQLSTIAFLIMTGHTDIASRVDALEAGADDLLFKPVDTDELTARVKSGLRLHQLTQALMAQTSRLESELAEAATYVTSLLPRDTPEDASNCVSITSRFISSQELGGDCFDHYWLDPDYLVVYLLDVSGHGLGAALLSTSVLNLLRSQSLPGVNFYRPESVLKGLNEAFQMNDQNDKYFTIWYGVYNRTNNQLSYASAGHPPALLITPQSRRQKLKKENIALEQLRTPGMPIGMMPDSIYQWQRCSVSRNSRLYIFSDGIYEICPASSTALKQQAHQNLLGLDGFTDLLTALEAQQNLTLDTLIDEVSAFGGNQFEDDLSLLEVDFQI